MRIVITGSTGYIGTFLQEELKAAAVQEILCLSGSRDDAPYIKTNYKDEAFAAALRGSDCIVHLAASKKVSSLEQAYDNVSLTRTVAEAAYQAGVKHFILASSISVYSGQDSLPWSEDMIAEPDNYYGLSKLMSEHVARMIYGRGAGKGKMFTILRISHVIGENMPGNYMMPVFFRRAAAGESLTVKGKSVARRELVDVRDVCRVIRSCINNDRVAGETLNVGPGSGLSNLEIARIMADCCPGVSVIYESDSPETIVSSYMDVAKLARFDIALPKGPEEAIRRICLAQQKLPQP